MFGYELFAEPIVGVFCGPVSLTSRWLPQLDLVSFRIDHTAKLTVLRVINFFEHVAALCFKRSNPSVKIVNAMVHHECRFARSELIACVWVRSWPNTMTMNWMVLMWLLVK
jgi:hypothetical protein